MIQEAFTQLTARFDNLQVKVEHLETKNAANEAKILQQEEEIVKLKAKIDSKCSSDFANNSPNNNKMSLTDKIESLPDGSLPRDVLPSSCRDLALIGHSLNGLYLVQNLVTNKVETVYCNFKTSKCSIHINKLAKYFG